MLFSFTDNVARRGCLSDQSSSNQLICTTSSSTTNTTSPLCTTCSGRENCNIDTVRKDENCITCNSALDRNCAQQPRLLGYQHCSVPSEGQCFTRIVGGATVRGCRGFLSEAASTQCRNNTVASQCAITSGPGSNNQILPMNRLRCFQCDSNVDETCIPKQENDTLALPCRKFVQPENCLKLTLNNGNGECRRDFNIKNSFSYRDILPVSISQSFADALLISAPTYASKDRARNAKTYQMDVISVTHQS